MAQPLDLTIEKGVTFGPIQIICKDADDVIVPLAGWSAFAEGRKFECGPIFINFAPIIEADDADGLITIPEVSWENTKLLHELTGRWDLILQDPTGRRLPPSIAGELIITNIITKSGT